MTRTGFWGYAPRSAAPAFNADATQQIASAARARPRIGKAAREFLEITDMFRSTIEHPAAGRQAPRRA
jgi:hypothetical protein